MPTLHALHGLPGSGKTTLALQLEHDLPAVRFSPDEWMIALHGTNPPVEVFRAQHEKIVGLIWAHAERVVRVGADVVLDFGFWSRASRDEVRARATVLGVALQFHSMDCPERVARERARRRTHEQASGALILDDAAFDAFRDQFEPMEADEPHRIVSAVSGLSL